MLRNGKYVRPNGKTFKDLMEGKLSITNNEKLTLNDFETHLATIFKEVRLKKYIEIRSLDTCEWDCHCGGPAFYTGLIYGNLDAALDIINKWDISEVLHAYTEVPKKGLKTIIGKKTLLEWGKIFLNISKTGLEKWDIKFIRGYEEYIFLRSVVNVLINNKNKATATIEKFKNQKNLDFLYEKI
jgi:glutamate--cysteine ligase